MMMAGEALPAEGKVRGPGARAIYPQGRQTGPLILSYLAHKALAPLI